MSVTAATTDEQLETEWCTKSRALYYTYTRARFFTPFAESTDRGTIGVRRRTYVYYGGCWAGRRGTGRTNRFRTAAVEIRNALKIWRRFFFLVRATFTALAILLPSTLPHTHLRHEKIRSSITRRVPISFLFIYTVFFDPRYSKRGAGRGFKCPVD